MIRDSNSHRRGCEVSVENDIQENHEHNEVRLDYQVELSA